MPEDKTYKSLLKILEKKKAGFILLLDPDDLPFKQITLKIKEAVEAGVDAFFVGGSFLIEKDFDAFVQKVKESANQKPVIIFPGNLRQISKSADALLFISLISGRNPEHLIGSQAMAAPIIWKIQLETISCGYMLIESGKLTSAEFVSNSIPIPRDKPGIAFAHALAAQYMGMKFVYLEAGSGAQYSVPESMIARLHKYIDIPIIVGGGIRTPQEAEKKVSAGAKFVVIGNYFENQNNNSFLKKFAEAIH